MKVLLDTNIWLDFYFGDRTNHKDAFNLINCLIEKEIDILTPASSLNNFFYLSDKRFKSLNKKKENNNDKIEA